MGTQTYAKWMKPLTTSCKTQMLFLSHVQDCVWRCIWGLESAHRRQHPVPAYSTGDPGWPGLAWPDLAPRIPGKLCSTVQPAADVSARRHTHYGSQTCNTTPAWPVGIISPLWQSIYTDRALLLILDSGRDPSCAKATVGLFYVKVQWKEMVIMRAYVLESENWKQSTAMLRFKKQGAVCSYSTVRLLPMLSR